MSEPSHSHSVGVEPDDVPAGFLAMLAAATTVVVVVLIGIAIAMFNHQVGVELKEKGYTDATLVGAECSNPAGEKVPCENPGAIKRGEKQ